MQVLTEQIIERFLELLKERGVERHAVSIRQNGSLLVEKGFEPYTDKSLHPLWSVTKSFTSLAIGFLEAEGKLKVEDLWLSYFPEYEEKIADVKFREVTVRHLLTMSLGQDCEVEVAEDEDPILKVLGKELTDEPGTMFLYNSHCSHLLSALVMKITGEKLIDYLRPRIFEPLEFETYHWTEDSQGRSIGGFGLHLSIHDLCKYAQCCLDDGIYQGKQVLPKEWLEKATVSQMENANVFPPERTENREGYGYHFWMCTHDAYRMSGMYGQICFIQKKNNLVVCMFNQTSGSQILLDCLFEAMEEQ